MTWRAWQRSQLQDNFFNKSRVLEIPRKKPNIPSLFAKYLYMQNQTGHTNYRGVSVHLSKEFRYQRLQEFMLCTVVGRMVLSKFIPESILVEYFVLIILNFSVYFCMYLEHQSSNQ